VILIQTRASRTLARTFGAAMDPNVAEVIKKAPISALAMIGVCRPSINRH